MEPASSNSDSSHCLYLLPNFLLKECASESTYVDLCLGVVEILNKKGEERFDRNDESLFEVFSFFHINAYFLVVSNFLSFGTRTLGKVHGKGWTVGRNRMIPALPWTLGKGRVEIDTVRMFFSVTD